jgi:drug/metabolite transporter (DMT)-like permease
MNRRNWSLLLLLSGLWGAAYLAIALALRDFSPAAVVFGRVTIAAAMLLPVALRRGALPTLAKRPWWLLITVLLQAAAPMLLLTYGQQRLSVGLTGILIGTQPLFVAVLSFRFHPDQAPRGLRGLTGLVIGFAGVALIFAGQVGGSPQVLHGGILVTGASLCYAAGSVLIHRKLQSVQPLGLATAAMVTAAAVLFLPGLLSLPSRPPSMTSSLALLALGVVFTGFTLRLFYGLIVQAGPGRAALAFYLSPGFAMVLGWALLDEAITWTTLLGLGAVVAGSILVAATNDTADP